MSRRALASILLLAAGAMLGCGSKAPRPGDRIAGSALTIYSSLPMHGTSSTSALEMLRGERLALAQVQGRIGSYRIVLRALDDSTLQRGEWDPGQTSQNAAIAVADPTAIGYLGDFNSGASAVSIPLLNRPGIPQVSAASSAVGLTKAGADASPGEPQKYYPTGERTFVRLVPSDRIEATVQVRLQRGDGCRRTYLLQDGSVDAEDIAGSYQVAAKAAALAVVAVGTFDPRASDYTALVTSIVQSGADCVLLAAGSEPGSAAVLEQLASAAPAMKLFGSAELADAAFAAPDQGGIPLALDPRMLITAPASSAQLLGYEAMSLMLAAVGDATHGGSKPARRSGVVHALFHTHNRHSVLGTYSVAASGDTTLRRYGIYRVVGGRIVLWTTVTAG